jgi:hypothetical protein
MLHSGNITATVLHVIKVCAHAKGGVHFGSAKSPEEQRLLDLDEKLVFNSIDSSLWLIQSVGRITLRALQPIVQSVLQQYPR